MLGRAGDTQNEEILTVLKMRGINIFRNSKNNIEKERELTRRCTMSHHTKMIEELVRKIQCRKDGYGSVFVTSVIAKPSDVWENIVTKIVPLHKSDSYTPKEKLDYGNFILTEELISVNALVELIKKLPEKGSTTITLGDYEVNVEGDYFQNGYRYDSGEEYLNIGWFFERYQYRGPSKSYQKEPIVSKDLPLFPDFRLAIKEHIGLDTQRYSDIYGIIICLPRYGAKIEKVNVSSKEIRLEILPNDTDLKNILGKIYCQRGEKVKHVDIEFKENSGIAPIGFNPDMMYVVLLSKADNEILDSRRYYSSWPSLPKGVIIDVPEYEIMELIRRGETETVEFKEDIGKPEEFAETAVAFANGEGGVILIGVDNHAKIVGLRQRKYATTITNVLRSHCDPQVECTIDRRTLDERDIIVLHVEEGRDKPYFVRDRGPYIRANGTDRIATRYEMDELYAQKQSGGTYTY